MNNDVKLVGIVALMIFVGFGAWFIMQKGMQYQPPYSASFDDIVKNSQKFHFNQVVHLNGLSFNATRIELYGNDNSTSYKSPVFVEKNRLYFIVENRLDESISFDKFRFSSLQFNSTQAMETQTDTFLLYCGNEHFFVSEKNDEIIHDICGVTYDPETNLTYYNGTVVDGFLVFETYVVVTKIPPHTNLQLVMLLHDNLLPEMEHFFSITTDYQKTFLYLDR